MIPNAYCKKHDEIEPQDHDIETHGLWVCKKCANSKKSGDLTENLKRVIINIGGNDDKQ